MTQRFHFPSIQRHNHGNFVPSKTFICLKPLVTRSVSRVLGPWKLEILENLKALCHCYNAVMDVKLLYSITCVVHLHPSIRDSGIVTSSAFRGFPWCPAGCFIIIGGGGDVSSLSEGMFHHYLRGRGDISSLSGKGECFIIIGEIFHHYRKEGKRRKMSKKTPTLLVGLEGGGGANSCSKISHFLKI